MRRLGVITAAALILAACSPTPGPGIPGPGGTTTLPPSGAGSPGSDTTLGVGGPGTTTALGPVEDNVVVRMTPFVNEMGAGWTSIDFSQGFAEGQLGPTVGPEHGTQTSDGRWWFVDNANRRFARFNSAGQFIDEIAIPSDAIAGAAPNYQAPRGLEGGTLAVYELRSGSTAIVRAFGDNITWTTVEGEVPWDYTDGSFLYGPIEDGTPAYRVEPWAGVVTDADWYVMRNQSRFVVTVQGSDILVDLIEYSTTVAIQLRLDEQPQIETEFEVQFVSAVDGTLYLLAYGTPLTDTSRHIGVLVTMDREGRVVRSQPIVDPRQGTGGEVRVQLGLLPDTASPWILVWRADGVRAFVRVN